MAKSVVLSIIDKTGDTRVSWNPDDPATIREAQKVFDDLKSKGHALYKIGEGGKTDQVTHAFDPNARMVAVPVVVGG